ncbi:protein kinase [Candidatus Uabimicrobium sp. HlEnr_7]|uniref:serine/threonine protein kinase n=1 Tax=Candidatus Uabimicrobium helgolandensis TaxID=3095367 RepID=UPI003558DFA8
MELYILIQCQFADKAVLHKAWQIYQQYQKTMSFIDFLLSKNIINSKQQKLMLSVQSILQNKLLEPKHLANYVTKYLQLRPSVSLYDWLIQQNILQHSPTKLIDSPSTVGRYKIIKKIGQGGMGDVFKAFDPYIKRHVAIKTMHSNRSSQRFLREIEACGKLQHANIVNIFDCGQQQNICYFVMDFIEGQTLCELIKQDLPIEKALILVEKIARALDYAHKMGVIHRDIKAQNILIDKEQQPHIVDFGLVKMENASELTKQNQVIGSVYYMSPEQIDSNWGEVSPRSDIYSLGVVMYQVLGGILPFSGQTQIEVMNRIMNVPPLSLRSIQKNISVEIEKICMKAMSKKIDERYDSAGQFADSIAALRDKPRISKRRMKKERPTTKYLSIALGALIIISVISGFLIKHKIVFPAITYRNANILTKEPYFLTAKDQITIRNVNNSYIYFFARKNGKIFTLDNYFVTPKNKVLQISAKEVTHHEDWLILPSHNKLPLKKIERVMSSFATRGLKTKKMGSYTSQQKIVWRIYGINENFTQTLLGSFSISPEPFAIDFMVRRKGQSMFEPISKIDHVVEGDQLQIRIFAHKKNHHLSMFFKDSKGEVGCIFPTENALQTESFSTYSKNKNMIYIPNKYEGFEFDEHVGKENILLFYQETAIDNQKLIAWLHNLPIPLSRDDQKSLSKLCTDFKTITILHK